jgi:anaphase-promoting complex subunit 3
VLLQVPNGAAGFFLLGKICRLSNRHDAAAQHFHAALMRDPTLWSAFEELCTLGMLCDGFCTCT